MNPTWDLIPFNQLCRTLARKTGEPADNYSMWSRDRIKAELETFDDGSMIIKEVSSLNDEQIASLEARLTHKVVEQGYSQFTRVEANFVLLRQEILAAIASTRRVEREYIVINHRQGSGETRPMGRQHMDFGTLLSLISTKQNVFLVGPAGSGKTMAAQAVAKALGLPFFFNGAIDSEYKLLGFTDAMGNVVHRPFRQAWTRGGVYLFDEVDASLPSAVLAFNAALSNDVCDFPDGCLPRHPDFYCMAAGNTFYGADHHYVGRMKQDAAFLDRFLVLDWHYDQDLERDLAIDLWPDNAQGALSWFEMICIVREEASRIGLQVVISPRATLGGVKLLRTGVPWHTAVRVTLRKTMNLSDWEKIDKHTTEPSETGTVSEVTEMNLPPGEEQPKYRDSEPEKPWYIPPKPKPFQVKSHGKTHRKFYKDLL